MLIRNRIQNFSKIVKKITNNVFVKKIITIVIITSITFSCLASCSANDANISDFREVIDMAGDTVSIPQNVTRVVSIIPYGGQFFVGLGLSKYLIAVSDDNVESKWWEVVCPNYNEIKIINENESAESLIAMKPDVVLVANPNDARELRGKGINAVTFQFYSIAELKKCLNLLVDIVGDEAREKVDEYIKYFDEKIMFVEETFKNKNIKKQSLYYINGISYKGFYKTTGNGSTNSELAHLSYVDYATDDLIESPMNYVDQEAILSKNPQNIIIGGRYQHRLYKEIFESKEWENVDAIKNKRVHTVPIGISAWNRYGLEMALMIPWTTAIVYGDVIEFDVKKEVREFYSKFMNYELSESDVMNIINGLMPNGKKEIEE